MINGAPSFNLNCYNVVCVLTAIGDIDLSHSPTRFASPSFRTGPRSISSCTVASLNSVTQERGFEMANFLRSKKY